MDKHHFILFDTNGEFIFSNLPASYQTCFDNSTKVGQMEICTCNSSNKKKRHQYFKSENGSVYFCTSDTDLINSTKLFKKYLDLYLSLLETIKKIKNDFSQEFYSENRRLHHNIVTHNAHIMQELENIIPIDQLRGSYEEQLNFITSIIKENPFELSKAYMKIFKENSLLKSELDVYRLLVDPQANIEKRYFILKRVLMKCFHVYFQDFSSKSVYVSVPDSSVKLRFNYDTVVVAFSHLIKNAAKYIAPKSTLEIFFIENPDNYTVQLEMLSLKITENDLENIFNPNYSGEFASHLNKKGSGIGMSVAKKALQINNAYIEIETLSSHTRNCTINGLPYEVNLFNIIFKDIN